MSRCASNVLPDRIRVELKLEAIGRGGLGHLLQHAFGLGGARAVLGREPVGVPGASRVDRGRRRGELERSPHDLDVSGMLELRERRLEPTLADVAPGARDIGPDVEAEGGHRGTVPREVTGGTQPHGTVSSRR